MENTYLGVWLITNTELSEEEWGELSSDIEELLAKHPKFGDLEFDVTMEEAP